MRRASVLVVALLVIVSGFSCGAFAKQHDSSSPLLAANKPVGRNSAADLIGEMKGVTLVLLSREKAVGLLKEGGTPGFIMSSKVSSKQPIVILCPGHSDYVKNSITALRKHPDWAELE